VTHDQVEALTFAQQVVVMTRGRAVQMGPAAELFERPSHSFVGYFIGSPGMNFLPVSSDGNALQCCGVPLGQPRAGQSVPAGDLKLGVRPEFVERVAPHSPGALPMVLKQVQDVGTHFIWSATIDGHLIKARLDAGAGSTALGETVWFKVLGDKTCIYRNEEIVA